MRPHISLWNKFSYSIRALFRRHKAETELDSELRFHLESQIENKIRAGMSPESARQSALREFGGVELAKEECRDERGAQFPEQLWQDVRFGARMLRKNPGFTAVAILTLALGIGANTAIFSVVEGVVLAPLPYSQPDRLVMVWESNPRFPRVYISYLNFLDWQHSARSFQQMTAFRALGFDVTNPGAPEHLDGKEISAGFFSTLGAKLTLGRDFSAQEDLHDGPPVIIISDRLWGNRFDASPAALGKSMTLNGVDSTIVGIAPPDFHLEGDADVFTPLGQGDPVVLNNRGSHDGILSIARLQPDVSISQARAEMKTIQSGLDQLYPEADKDLGAGIDPLKHLIIGDAGGTLLLLLGAAGLVLLIACANVANLVLARSAARMREFAIRVALGASRARVMRQLVTEGVILSVVGGTAGLAIASWGMHALLAAIPSTLPRTENIHMNLGVLLFTLVTSIVIGILFSVVPAMKSSKTDPQAALKEGGRGSTRAHHRIQSSLIVAQMALTLILLVGAGLLLRTIRHLWDVHAGFDAENVITFRIGVSDSLTKTAETTRIAYRQLIERIREIPGVSAADFDDALPLSGQGGTMPFWIGSQRPASLQAAPRLAIFVTGPDYLQAMKIPLLQGRFFNSQDTQKSPCVFVIDSVFAHMYFPTSDPVGQTITAGFAPVGPCRIVGVVGHVSNFGLAEAPTSIQNQGYFPLYQDPDEWVQEGYSGAVVIVRTSLSTASVMSAVKTAVRGAGADQPIYDVRTMREIVSQSMSSQRFPMILLGAFAALALLLASVGIYGVISYSVTLRVHEIGIRMALGAEKRNIFRMVIGQGLQLAILGLAIGAASALILARLLSSFSHLLYGIGASDPLTFATVSFLLTCVALLASYIPARRATRVDPMTALRNE